MEMSEEVKVQVHWHHQQCHRTLLVQQATPPTSPQSN
jgi:hypothetical protein